MVPGCCPAKHRAIEIEVCRGDGVTWILHCGHVRLGAVSNHWVRLRREKTDGQSLRAGSAAPRGQPQLSSRQQDTASFYSLETQMCSPEVQLRGTPCSSTWTPPLPPKQFPAEFSTTAYLYQDRVFTELTSPWEEPLNNRSFAGVSGSRYRAAQELPYQDTAAGRPPVWSAPEGATNTKHAATARERDPASLCSGTVTANPWGSPEELLSHCAAKPSRHTHNSLFLEQGNNLDVAGYLRELSVLRRVLEEREPELCRW